MSSRELFHSVGAKSIHGRSYKRTRTHPRLQWRARLFVPLFVLRASAPKTKTIQCPALALSHRTPMPRHRRHQHSNQFKVFSSSPPGQCASGPRYPPPVPAPFSRRRRPARPGTLCRTSRPRPSAAIAPREIEVDGAAAHAEHRRVQVAARARRLTLIRNLATKRPEKVSSMTRYIKTFCPLSDISFPHCDSQVIRQFP
jgi:hypothetical protein